MHVLLTGDIELMCQWKMISL